MLDITKLLIDLTRCRVCGGALAGSLEMSDEEVKALYRLAKSHDIAHIISVAIEGAEGISDEAKDAFRKQRFTAVYRYGCSSYELGVLSEALEKAKIGFMPLKGSVIRDYYPEAWMRTSCDIDVLIRKEDLENAISALVNAGYEERYSSPHDVSLYSKSGVHIELHFTLIEDGRVNESSDVLGRVWDYARPAEGCVYKRVMSDDMFYFYHIAHMAKHFEDGGCGVRPFLDLWILNHRVDVVRSSREALLREGNLLKFAEACEALSEAWFGSDGHNELTLKMQDYLINSGVYGKLENQVAINSAKAGGGIGYILSRIWPSYEKLTITYPGLKGRKILIPLYQVRRWFRIVFSGGLKKMRTEVSVSSRQSDDEAEKIVEFFNELGLH